MLIYVGLNQLNDNKNVLKMLVFSEFKMYFVLFLWGFKKNIFIV